jgi:hypothetical protein
MDFSQLAEIETTAVGNLTLTQAIQLGLFIIICYAVLFVVDKTVASRLFRHDFSERERLMRDKIVQLETTVNVLSTQLNEKAQIEFEQRLGSQQRDNKIEALTREIQELNRQLLAANEKMRSLTQQLEQRQVIDKQPRDVIVLAIWPDPPENEPDLDIAGEAQALANSGFTYHVIKGRAANVNGVVREMDRVNPTTLEIGAHDDGHGNIILSSGPTEPAWWGELITNRNIDLVMLMACRGNIQDSLNVSDIMLRAGAKAVVSFDEAVEDSEAVIFAKMVYEKLAERRPISDAVARAKLVVKRTTREIIRLRVRTQSGNPIDVPSTGGGRASS